MNRRGFLGAIIAGAVAPAFVKAGNIMPLWVPKHVLDLSPKLVLNVESLKPNSEFTFSTYLKTPGGTWEKHVIHAKTQTGKASLEIDLPSNNTIAWGTQLEGLHIGNANINMSIKNGVLAYDQAQTPVHKGQQIITKHEVIRF